MLAGMALIFIGILVIVLGTLIMALRSGKEDLKIEGGGIVFIGPIPIIWGTTKAITKAMLILALVITVLLIVFYMYLSRSQPIMR